MTRVLVSVCFVWFFAGFAAAQDRFWVQVEAQPTLTEATERARDYARRFDDVQGYYLGTGFYGIVLGPYSEAAARQELTRLRGSRQIPSDSYLQNGRGFEQQFWPIGGAQAAVTGVDPETLPALAPVSISDVQETTAEARVSEGNLSRDDREELQRALQWAGFYNAAIDGSFGRGTRRAMEEWQVANRQQPTGILTTQQRAALIRQYNADLIDVAMAPVSSIEAGIALDMPTAVVQFESFQPPFANYTGTSSLPTAQVLLISQPGNTERLAGLYELMQVLEVIPPDGPRSLRNNSFTIEGVDEERHSFTSVSLANGEIKGFTLVWPSGDERRRARILTEMVRSFTRLDGTLDPALAPATEEQTVNMVAGLSVRQPQFSRSGFFVSNDGLVLTTTEAVQGCQRVTIDRKTNAEVLASYDDFGLAILRPLEAVAPIDFAAFQLGIPRLQDAIAIAGYPFDGALPAPTLNFGTLVDMRNLSNDDRIKRLEVLAEPSNAGGPVLDENGAVLGMLLPRQGGAAQALPQEVQFSLDADVIVGLLERTGIASNTNSPNAAKTPFALQAQAADMTVLVSCW